MDEGWDSFSGHCPAGHFYFSGQWKTSQKAGTTPATSSLAPQWTQLVEVPRGWGAMKRRGEMWPVCAHCKHP